MKNGIFAIINIGTSAFRMEIGLFEKGKYKQLEYLVKSLSLGKDTFSKGFISSESIEKAYEILKKFKSKMNEYKIGKKFSAIATSGVREAKNREFFIDYVEKKLGIKINILTPHEELYIRYIGIKNEFDNFCNFEKKGVALVNVSSGNVSMVIVKNKTIMYADSLHFGSLRLNEIFDDVEEKDKVFAYERYINSMIGNVENVIHTQKIENIVFSGSSINVLKHIFLPEHNFLLKKDISNLYNEIKRMSEEEIKNRYELRLNEAEILKPMVSIYKTVLDLFESEKFYFSKTTFPRKLLLYYSRSYKKGHLRDYLENTMLHIGRKYEFDEKHALNVRKFALKLFDELKDIHLLNKRYKNLLEIAALLHDVGYFINEENHAEHSYYIIKSLHLPQTDENDIKIIALVALLHKEKVESVFLRLYNYLSQKEMFDLNKLASILRIADALDASHKQLIKDITVEFKTNSIMIKARSDNFIYFEGASMRRKAKLFENTFGIKVFLEHIIG